MCIIPFTKQGTQLPTATRDAATQVPSETSSSPEGLVQVLSSDGETAEQIQTQHLQIRVQRSALGGDPQFCAP